MYKSSGAIGRMSKIGKREVHYHDIAHYISAYRVHNKQIHNIEALLTRCFPNDLANIHVERFKEK